MNWATLEARLRLVRPRGVKDTARLVALVQAVEAGARAGAAEKRQEA